jgi:ParB family chromosome partitioning protein
MTHDLALREVVCDSIRVSGRHRKDMGDLDALAASIAAEGLLQPIGITENNLLVFGERRLLAVRDILRHATIAARVVRVSSIAAGEYAENEIRKDFTPSERVDIGKALEAEVGDRRGQRTDRQVPEHVPALDPTSSSCPLVEDIPQVEPDPAEDDCATTELPKYISEVEPGVETRDFAAKKAGFGNFTTYEQAKRVVDHGAPELVAAMDSGEVSISAAAVIALQPADRQSEIVRTPRELRRQIVREIREAIDLPTTAEARRLARETGNLVADRTGRYRSGASAEERAATKADLDAIWDVTRGVLAIADTKLDPEELAARLEYWHCPDIRAKTPLALAWLTKFQMAVEDNDQIS